MRLTYIPLLLISFSLILSCSVGVKKVDYSEVIQNLEVAIDYEMKDKSLPGFAIVLVDDKKIIWSKNYGLEDPDKNKRANENTVYRIGSVSKLFTDIAVMQLVDKGVIDLDLPVSTYLPDFSPNNSTGVDITLRQLMSHKSGLIREPRVGHYFDDTNPSLEATVQSLNGTSLIYEPETRTKYSNAGIAVVGRVLEKTQNIAFNEYLSEKVLVPMGMTNSSFGPSSFTSDHLAYGEMWSYDGRKFRAPTFELGMSPAGSMYSTMNDLGKFIQVLLNNGMAGEEQVISSGALQKMWEPQFDMDGYGIGFRLSPFQDRRRVGHGGAIYGFSTQLFAMPDDNIGVAAVSTADVTNAITTRIAEYGLDLLLATSNGEELKEYPQYELLSREEAQKYTGRYQNEGNEVSVEWLNEEATIKLGSFENRLKKSENAGHLLMDGRLGVGQEMEFTQEGFHVGELSFFKLDKEIPVEDDDLKEYLGEYGWDFNVLFVYEEYGSLYALIEWTSKDKLTQIEKDLFAFPKDGGLYHGELLKFNRDENDQIISAEIQNSVNFPKRATADANQTFRITLLKPVNELRKIALEASPPRETGKNEADLIEPSVLDPTIKLDIRYASTNNFMSTEFYEQARAFMQRPAAMAVVEANKILKSHGLGLLIHDAYRPWYVTKMFWDATPDDKKIFVANPDRGSRHNRGCAVDITLYDLATGEVIEMPAGYDEMSERSYPNYMGGTEKQRWYRRLLRETMESVGFSIYEFEWWHFDYKTWNDYPVLNLRFEELE